MDEPQEMCILSPAKSSSVLSSGLVGSVSTPSGVEEVVSTPSGSANEGWSDTDNVAAARDRSISSNPAPVLTQERRKRTRGKFRSSLVIVGILWCRLYTEVDSQILENLEVWHSK